MRGLVLIFIFFGLLLLVFKRPYIGVLMWFWISLMNPHRIIYGFAASISYALLIALVTLGSWMLLHPEEPRMPPRDRFTFLMLALMVWVSITSLNGVGPPDDIMMQWGLAEKMGLMTLVAYALTNTRERFDQLVLICVLSVAFWGFRGGAFTIVHGGAFRVYGPPETMIGDNNDLGVALTMNLPLLFYLHQRYTAPRFRWPLRVLIGFVVIGDLFTYSRGALLAIAATAGALWLRTRNKAVTGIAIVVALVAVLHFAPPEWFERMQTIHSYEEDQSAESRLWLWQISWEMVKKNPITGGGFHWSWNWPWVNQHIIPGTGLRPMIISRAPHSIWFEMLSNHGFIGLALFIGFIVLTALNAQWLIRRTRGSPELLWANIFGRMLQAALIGYVIGGSFANFDMYDGFYALALMGAVARRVAAAELAAQKRPVEAPLAGALPLPAASRVQASRPLVRT